MPSSDETHRQARPVATDEDLLVVGRVVGVEPTRDALAELRRGDFEVLWTRSPRPTAVPDAPHVEAGTEDEGEVGPLDVRAVLRETFIGAALGLVASMVLGAAFAGVVAAGNDSDTTTLLAGSILGFAVVGASLGVFFGRGFALAEEDALPPQRSFLDGHTEIAVRAHDLDEAEEIRAILDPYADTSLVRRERP